MTCIKGTCIRGYIPGTYSRLDGGGIRKTEGGMITEKNWSAKLKEFEDQVEYFKAYGNRRADPSPGQYIVFCHCVNCGRELEVI